MSAVSTRNDRSTRIGELNRNPLDANRAGMTISTGCQIERAGAHRTLEGWSQQYGDSFRVTFGRRPILVIADPAAIGKMLREAEGLVLVTEEEIDRAEMSAGG